MIALRHSTTGEVQFVRSIAGYGTDWQPYGPSVPDDADASEMMLVGGAWVASAAKVEARLVQRVKQEAERRKMAVRSPGSGKSAEYREKRAEALASANVLATVLNGLTAAEALKQFPAAAIERKLTGEPLAAVLARYLAASNAADAEVYRLAAIEQGAVTRIKVAAMAAEKRAAYSATNWGWQPA